MKNEFYFYTYDSKDGVRIQQKRILGYTTKETLIIESLSDSQTHSRYGDGTHCANHYHYWTKEESRIRNFLSEFERQTAIEAENKSKGKICCVCDSSKGVLYDTNTNEYIHSECTTNLTLEGEKQT